MLRNFSTWIYQLRIKLVFIVFSKPLPSSTPKDHMLQTSWDIRQHLCHLHSCSTQHLPLNPRPLLLLPITSHHHFLMEYLLKVMQIFRHLKAIFFHDGPRTSSSLHPLLLEWHQQIATISDNWPLDWANQEEYNPTFENGIALIISCINERLRDLGYPNEIWFDYKEQLRSNYITRRHFLE